MGFNARQTMILILLISCIFSGINILLVSYMNNTLILLGDVVVWMGLNFMVE